MTNNAGLAFSVGDTTPQFTISIEARQMELVTLNIIFGVLIPLFNYYCNMLCGSIFKLAPREFRVMIPYHWFSSIVAWFYDLL